MISPALCDIRRPNTELSRGCSEDINTSLMQLWFIIFLPSWCINGDEKRASDGMFTWSVGTLPLRGMDLL
jgi:hypothetical protein